MGKKKRTYVVIDKYIGMGHYKNLLNGVVIDQTTEFDNIVIDGSAYTNGKLTYKNLLTPEELKRI